VPATSPRPHPSDLTDEQWALIEPIVAAPGRVAADDGHEPGVRVGGDQLDPVKPQAVRSRKNSSQPAPSSLVVTLQAEDLAVPVGVDPGGTSACTGTTRPPSRPLTTSGRPRR
jgi:hypothetical protein